ncbi:sulfotransferase family cytosolic 1B member 1-like [Pollicipes pollicipes]|uniref:sulfotransferase family cytosolic 1B member 1-like n=1 Tax=Pollicipes pollicipes TaxID=41117 RepID=UPI001885819F|nr:sulfotransferase family cytosolic 1B member 1-like [Pollicipes pollicipes]
MPGQLPLPWAPESPTPEEDARLRAAYSALQPHGVAMFGPSRVVLAPDAAPALARCYNTPLHPDDTWVVTLPKSGEETGRGTTWTQELVWLLLNDCDFTGARTMLMPDRWHFHDIQVITTADTRAAVRAAPGTPSSRIFFEPIEARPRPWFVKTHLPLHMCPPRLIDTCKVIYVARNPKDMCVSFFHHQHLFRKAAPSLGMEEFVDLFIDGLTVSLPYFPHVLEAWKQRHHPNMLFLFFEDLKKDLRGSIIKVAEFLGKPTTEKQLDELEQHLHFRNLKDNPWVNWEWLSSSVWSVGQNRKFMRKGQTGDWKNHFTRESDRKIETWMKKELQNTDLTFVTDIPEGQQ